MDVCYNCGKEITPEKISEEHIIPNSCGGKLKSTHIICSDCNGFFGENFDRELAKQINSVANLLLIKRERGEPQKIYGETESRQRYYIDSKGNPVLAAPVVNIQENSFNILARDEREFEKILNGIKKKHPHIDVDEINKNAERKNELLTQPIRIDATIGGIDVFRAIAKIAVNYYIYKGGNRKYILSTLPFLNGRSTDSTVWMHYPDVEAHAVETETVNHIIHLTGNPDQKVLFCRVELFSLYSYVVLLDDEYDGQRVNNFYCYNVINQNVTHGHELIPLSREDVLNIVRQKMPFPVKNVQRKINDVFTIVNARQHQNLVSELSKKVVNNVLGNYPEGAEITNSMIDELSEEYLKAIMPYVERNAHASSDD